MTAFEFRCKTPGIIIHEAWGEDVLEIIDKPSKKAAYYLHKNNTSSHFSVGKTWVEVSEKINILLIKN